ncbi:hypothetical protein KKP04_02290 [Rhodomicrobium sp. Az07]|uniref:hypothetical protein n=1 Tax=Rhodomicrobium sp. Az07 TaxID=2839034 RepID=UPI001BE7AD2C|nr:hypothetical protein [Rhodomicrobium sp. Az07]MBT3069699.1 hypothetical protein [Rhodomicrobium sp. Az07]
MLFLRASGLTLLLGAFVALVYDGIRLVGSPGRSLPFTSLSAQLDRAPHGHDAVQQFFLDNAPSYLWTGVIEPLLVLPIFLLFGVAGTLFFLAGYRKPPPEIVGD